MNKLDRFVNVLVLALGGLSMVITVIPGVILWLVAGIAMLIVIPIYYIITGEDKDWTDFLLDMFFWFTAPGFMPAYDWTDERRQQWEQMKQQQKRQQKYSDSCNSCNFDCVSNMNGKCDRESECYYDIIQ